MPTVSDERLWVVHVTLLSCSTLPVGSSSPTSTVQPNASPHTNANWMKPITSDRVIVILLCKLPIPIHCSLGEATGHHSNYRASSKSFALQNKAGEWSDRCFRPGANRQPSRERPRPAN